MCQLYILTNKGVINPPGGEGLLTRLWIGVCSPGLHTPYPSQTKIFHPSQRERSKITTLTRMSVSHQDQTRPLPDCWAWKQHPSQTETVKNVPLPDCWGWKQHPSQTEIVKTYPQSIPPPGINQAPWHCSAQMGTDGSSICPGYFGFTIAVGCKISRLQSNCHMYSQVGSGGLCEKCSSDLPGYNFGTVLSRSLVPLVNKLLASTLFLFVCLFVCLHWLCLSVECELHTWFVLFFFWKYTYVINPLMQVLYQSSLCDTGQRSWFQGCIAMSAMSKYLLFQEWHWISWVPNKPPNLVPCSSQDTSLELGRGLVAEFHCYCNLLLSFSHVAL